MPQYRYKAKSMDGKVCRGRMEALTERDLLKRLEDQGLYCFGWREESKGRARRKIPLGAGLLAPLCRELSVMLSAGVPLAEILAVSGEMAGSSRLKKEILRVREEVYQGHSLSEAMESGEGTFPSLLIYMIRAGETGGELEEILRKMAEYYERQRELGGKIRTAMIYPLILFAATVFVSIFLVAEVLPQFVSLLEGQPLPLFTRILLEAGAYMGSHGAQPLLFVPVPAVLLIGIFHIPSVRLALDRAIIHIPVIGKIVKTIDTARFSQTFGILYGNGAGILEALDLTGQVMGNSYIRKSLKDVAEELKRGRLLSGSLEEADIFLPVFVSMVAAGEESGRLDQVLGEAGIYYEKEAERAVNQMVVRLEPAMILIMAIVVGGMILAVMTPVFQMYSSML